MANDYTKFERKIRNYDLPACFFNEYGQPFIVEKVIVDDMNCIKTRKFDGEHFVNILFYENGRVDTWYEVK